MKILTVISLIFLLATGCQESNIVEPLEGNLNSLYKNPDTEAISVFDMKSDECKTSNYLSLPNWIELPARGTLNKNADNSEGYSITKFVPTDEDTELIIDDNYIGGVHGEVKIIVKLKFYAGTVKEDNYVTMNVNDKNGTVTFEPSQVFNRDAELYVKFEGIDLYETTREDIDFVYIGKDGSTIPIKYKEIQYDKSSGTLELKEGKVPHFSRYGWTRKK